MTSISTEFGRIVDPSQIEQAVTAVLKEWFPSFLHELELQRGLAQGTLVPPISYTQRNTFDSLPGEELPKCVVVSPGLAGPPHKYQYGLYRASWRLGVGIAVADKDADIATMKAKLSSAAAKAILVKFHTLGDLDAKITWVDQNSDEIPIASKIWNYRASAEFFVVDVENVVNAGVRPSVPNLPPDEYNYGQADTVTVDLSVKGITDA